MPQKDDTPGLLQIAGVQYQRPAAAALGMLVASIIMVTWHVGR